MAEKSVGERIVSAAINSLKKEEVPINISVDYARTQSVGGEVVLWAVCSQKGAVDFDNPVILGSSVLLEKEKSAEQVGKEVAEKLSFERDILQISIDKFLNSKVDETVINIEEIDNELVNKIHDFIDNHADCKILASALQFQSQTNREIFLFVTADEKDFSPNGYKFLIDQFVIIGLNKKYKFPELYNLRFTN